MTWRKTPQIFLLVLWPALFPLVFLWLLLPASGLLAQERIGREALLARPQAAASLGKETLINLPENALWSTIANFRPGDGEIADLNPPRFSWSYTPNPLDYEEIDRLPYLFLLQISPDPNFSSKTVEVLTRSNLYNTLPPFPSPGTYYWRVGYIVDTEMDRGVANGMPRCLVSTKDPVKIAQFKPLKWSRVRSLMVPAGARRWDRSMLADENYLREKGRHPHILFNEETRRPLFKYLEAVEKKYLTVYKNRIPTRTNEMIEFDAGKGWHYAKRYAYETISAAWWKTWWNAAAGAWWADGSPASTTALVADGIRAIRISNVSFVWQLTKDQGPISVFIAGKGEARVKLGEALQNAKPQDALVRLAEYYLAIKADQRDSSGSINGDMIRVLGFGYDWLFSLMTSEQQKQVRKAIEANCNFVTKGGIWWWNPKNRSIFYGKGDPTWEYAGGAYVPSFLHSKMGASHQTSNFERAIVAALAAYPQSGSPGDDYPQKGAARELFDLGVHYMIGKVYPFGNEEGMNQGRGYSAISISDLQRSVLGTAMLYQLSFPEAQFNQNPYFHSISDWWSRIAPVGFTEGHSQWGDSGWGMFSFWQQNHFGRNLAFFVGGADRLQGGRTLRHWREAIEVYPYTRSYIDPVEMLPTPFYATTEQSGFRIPSEEGSTTSLSRVFPSGGWAMGCSHPTNTKDCYKNGVGFVMQARPYGAWSHSANGDLSFDIWAYNTTITDGGAEGIIQVHGHHPMERYALLVNGLGPYSWRYMDQPYYCRFFAYAVSRDGAQVEYTYAAADGTNAYPLRPFAAEIPVYRGAPLSFLQKVRRHLLFMRKKYFVVFDDAGGSKAATFTSLYHVLENTLHLDPASASFRYTSNIQKLTSKKPETVTVPDVTVHVKYVNDPATLAITDLTGAQVQSNPITGEDYYESVKQYDAHLRAHALWVSNKVPQTNWHFMYVIYPVKPGTSAPTITRVDDFTVKVSKDGEEDIISFNNNASATLVVDLPQILPPDVRGSKEFLNPSSTGPSSPQNLRIRP
jgi:hypothetical protein